MRPIDSDKLKRFVLNNIMVYRDELSIHEIVDMIDSMPTVNINEWISVEDEYPQPYDSNENKETDDFEVLVQTKRGELFIAYLVINSKWNGSYEFTWYTHGTGGRRMKVMSKVLYWMPKPKLIEEE